MRWSGGEGAVQMVSARDTACHRVPGQKPFPMVEFMVRPSGRWKSRGCAIMLPVVAHGANRSHSTEIAHMRTGESVQKAGAQLRDVPYVVVGPPNAKLSSRHGPEPGPPRLKVLPPGSSRGAGLRFGALFGLQKA